MSEFHFVKDEKSGVDRAYKYAPESTDENDIFVVAYEGPDMRCVNIRFTRTEIIRIDGGLYKLNLPIKKAVYGDKVLYCGEIYTVTSTEEDYWTGKYELEMVRGCHTVSTDRHDIYRVITPYIKYQPEKPPLGITPRFLLDEKRMDEIASGIARYTSVYKPIPSEWIEEYNELAEREASRKE